MRFGKIKCAAKALANVSACSSFNFTKRWHFICRYNVRLLSFLPYLQPVRFANRFAFLTLIVKGLPAHFVRCHLLQIYITSDLSTASTSSHGALPKALQLNASRSVSFFNAPQLTNASIRRCVALKKPVTYVTGFVARPGFEPGTSG